MLKFTNCVATWKSPRHSVAVNVLILILVTPFQLIPMDENEVLRALTIWGEGRPKETRLISFGRPNEYTRGR